MIDHDTFGFSSGVRTWGPSVDGSHLSVTALMREMAKYSELTTFLCGNSMGCMILKTYLLRNPDLRIAGVIFIVPFFYVPESIEDRDTKVAAAGMIGPLLEDFVSNTQIGPSHLSKNMAFTAKLLIARKTSPFLTPNVVNRFAQSFVYIRENAQRFTYPFMTLIGLKDVVVCNYRAREIFAKAGSKEKELVEIEDGRH